MLVLCAPYSWSLRPRLAPDRWRQNRRSKPAGLGAAAGKTNPRAGDLGCSESETGYMTLTDYLINIALIALVILQIRGSRLDLKSAIRPVILVAAAAVYYLRAFPTAGNDVILYAVLGGIGVAGIGAEAGSRVPLFVDLGLDAMRPDGAGVLCLHRPIRQHDVVHGIHHLP